MAWIIGFTPKAQLEQFQQRMHDIGSKRAPRATQFALNGIAISAAKESSKVVAKALDRPTPWALRAFFAVKGNLGQASKVGIKNLWSAIKVKDQQSTVFKYLFGDGRNDRRPGDVGLAEKSILLPVESNLKSIGIKMTSKGNLPKNAVSRIMSNSANGAFWSKARMIRVGSVRRKLPAGLYARPAKIWVGVKGDRWQGRDAQGRFTKDARPNRGHGFKRANAGLPVLMLRSVPMTRHLGILQRPVEKFAGKKMSELGARLTKELRTELARDAGKASAASRRASRQARVEAVRRAKIAERGGKA